LSKAIRSGITAGITKSSSTPFVTILNAVTAFVFIAIILCHATPCDAENGPIASNDASPISAVQEYFADWFPRVTRVQSEQPHWVTPLVTVTSRLEEEFRYDQFWQSQPHGVTTDNFGGGKGLELIPFQNVELILGVPAWIAHKKAIQHANKKKHEAAK
jgi:hypothetical protein